MENTLFPEAVTQRLSYGTSKNDLLWERWRVIPEPFEPSPYPLMGRRSQQQAMT
jgi:hypothetical protein